MWVHVVVSGRSTAVRVDVEDGKGMWSQISHPTSEAVFAWKQSRLSKDIVLLPMLSKTVLCLGQAIVLDSSASGRWQISSSSHVDSKHISKSPRSAWSTSVDQIPVEHGFCTPQADQTRNALEVRSRGWIISKTSTNALELLANRLMMIVLDRSVRLASACIMLLSVARERVVQRLSADGSASELTTAVLNTRREDANVRDEKEGLEAFGSVALAPYLALIYTSQ